MTDRLSVMQILVLCGYATAMAGGQLLFKLSAQRAPAGVPLAERFVALMQDWLFLATLVVYFGLTLLWVWILSFTPLSRAYPFVALAFALTPVLAAVFFAEPMTLRLAIGIAVIFVGLILVSG